jgi:hypothetical protein
VFIGFLDFFKLAYGDTLDFKQFVRITLQNIESAYPEPFNDIGGGLSANAGDKAGSEIAPYSLNRARDDFFPLADVELEPVF